MGLEFGLGQALLRAIDSVKRVFVARNSVSLVHETETVSTVCASLLQVRVQRGNNRFFLFSKSRACYEPDPTKLFSISYRVYDVTGFKVFVCYEDFLVVSILY